MTQLYGITGTKNTHARNVRNIICDGASLLHTNIKQPVFKCLSALTGISEYELEHHVDLHKKLNGRDYSAMQLYTDIERDLTSANPNALIDAAEEDMLSKRIIKRFANGYLVTGIDNEAEANWLRGCEGVLIHLIDTNAHTPTPIAIHDNDFVIELSTSIPPTRDCLQPFISKLIALSKAQKQQREAA